jgi:hypothetical protein
LHFSVACRFQKARLMREQQSDRLLIHLLAFPGKKREKGRATGAVASVPASHS